MIHLHFVPDILESGAVVGLCFGEDGPVGYMDDPPGTLVSMDPVSDLQEGKLEEADVDHIPGLLPDLNPIAHAKWFTGEDKDPPCNIGERILQGDGQSGREQSKEGPELTYGPDPYTADQNHQENPHNE